MPAIEKLGVTAHQKIWGTPNTEPWFASLGDPMGEVWFDTPEEQFPLLIKFVFTSQALSIQVHPNDEQAQASGHLRGKTEMWHILRAAPGAAVGVGLKRSISQEELRSACLSGEIETLLDWKPVRPDDVIFVPAGTIHAIGAGLALCEIQQYSDITYRLYDYGRPRELHLDAGIAVSKPEPYPLTVMPQSEVLCPYFTTTHHIVPDNQSIDMLSGEQPEVVVVLEGDGEIDGQPYREGEAFYVPPGCGSVDVHPSRPTSLLRTTQSVQR